MTVEHLDVKGFKGLVIAIPVGDCLLNWVDHNCPQSMPEAEFIRLLCSVGQQFMSQAMDKLKTDAEGVLQFVEHSDLSSCH